MKNPHSVLMIAAASVLFFSCKRRDLDDAAEETPKITEDALAQFPAGSTLASLKEYFKLERATFSGHPNQPIGHMQGWYLVSEGDMMVSATLSEKGVMVLDETPWILTNEDKANIPSHSENVKLSNSYEPSPSQPSSSR